MESLGGKLKYMINYALYLAHYDAYYHVNDDAWQCRYFSVTNNFTFSPNSFKLLPHINYCKKYSLPWMH